MGAACCTATTGNNLHKNSRCSSSWNFHWENRRRVAGETEDSLSRVVTAEVKRSLGSDRGNLSNNVSRHEISSSTASLKSLHGRIRASLIAQPSGLSLESSYHAYAHNSAESPDVAGAELSAPKLSYSLHSSFSTPSTDPLPTNGRQLPLNSTLSRRARHSPEHQLFGQISDGQILGLKSPSSYSLSEGRSTLVHSSYNQNITTGSLDGSSRDWSFNSENFDYGFRKLIECRSRFSCSSSLEFQTCGACTKTLTENSSSSGQRCYPIDELRVVSVLVCGHVYHAECLEAMTLEVDKHDPRCPLCMGGEKQVSKDLKKENPITMVN